MRLLEKLQDYEEKYQELSEMLADPKISNDAEKIKEYSKRMADLEELVNTIKNYKEILKEIEDTREMLQSEVDEELAELVKNEISELNEKAHEIESKISLLLIPQDPNDSKNIIIEIRAGTGGD